MLRRCVAAWEVCQVELHGKYSPARVLALQAYCCSASLCRVALVCVLTPLPCLAVVLLVDLLPLRPPQDGLHANALFFVRLWLSVAWISIGTLVQLRDCLPHLTLSNQALASLTVVATTACTSVCWLLAHVIGFPLPFTPMFGGAVWAATLLLGCACYWRTLLRENALLRAELVEYVGTFLFMLSLTFVYPAYIFAFNRLDGTGFVQNAFVVVLVVVKIVMRNGVRRFLRSDDHASEVVIFNVDVFHSLYVSCSFQSATSTATTVIVVAIDVLQMGVSISDIYARYAELQVVLRRLHATRRRPRQSFLALTVELLQDPLVRDHPRLLTAVRVSAVPHKIAPGDGLVPQCPTASAVVPPLPSLLLPSHSSAWSLDDRVTVVALATRLLFLVEFTVLVELTEVIMPLVYGVYSVALANLSNRQFYPRLVELPPDQLYAATLSTVRYAAVELLTFLVFVTAVGAWLDVPLLRQAAFVLERHAGGVQTKLVLWLTFIVQCQLLHFGLDFSMQFDWLPSRTGDT